MSLDLDKRQRAMLREMGVRVWQPVVDTAPKTGAAQNATEIVDVNPVKTGAKVISDLPPPIKTVSAAQRPQQAVPASLPAATRPKVTPQDRPDPSVANWSVGQAQALYPFTTPDGARWLVLTEAPASALQAQNFNPMEGDAGKLLDNMLRAAGLNKAGAVLLAPLVRRAPAESEANDLLTALHVLLDHARPDVVLVMGRLAAQALLQSAEPFGKLRGQVHGLHGIKTIVTHDAAYLLRTPLDKAKAWDDLCLAMHVARNLTGP